MKDHTDGLQLQDLVCVSNNVVIEPLINSWYAWAHLVSPATLALNIRHRHLAIMDSYIQFPKAHAMAIKNPAMLGGPFIDYNGERVDEIKELRDKTMSQCDALLQLSDSVSALNAMLAQKGKGFALGDLYDEVPANLRGLVELYYDLNNNATYRFFESLLYDSEYYDDSFQSVNIFTIHADDSRSFVLSTPRLPNKNLLSMRMKFKDSRIDSFFETSRRPIKYQELKDMFEITENEEVLFKSFLTNQEPSPYKKYNGQGVLTRYFGHASILIETSEVSIMVDPVISYGYESDLSRYTFADLPDRIDFVCITHNHQDHVLIETLLRIRHKVGCVVVPRNNSGELQDPSLKLFFEKLGFTNVVELNEMETLHFSTCSITGVPFLGEHADLNIRSKICPLVDFNGKLMILFAADSCNQEPMLYERIQRKIKNIDVIFLGMECEGAPLSWLYGPLLPSKIEREKDQSRRFAGCNFTQAKSLIDIFKPKEVFVYAMGLEPWLKYISSIRYTDESKAIVESNRILEYCKERGMLAERLFGEKILEYPII